MSLTIHQAAPELVATVHGYFPHFHRFEGGIVTLPSDFLIDERGVIVDLNDGEHFGDSWSVSEVLARVARAAPAGSNPAPACAVVLEAA